MLFQFGSGDVPLTMIAGGLIYDTGEAERTFFYRCQDRFLTYGALMGWPMLFLAADDAHVARYLELIGTLRLRYEAVRAATGLMADLPCAEPWFALLDPDRLELAPSSRMRERLDQGGTLPASGVALNQISPTYAAFLAGLDRVFSGLGQAVGIDVAGARTQAVNAMAFQDKDVACRLAERHLSGGGLHLATAILFEADARRFGGWRDLAEAFEAQTGARAPERVFIKTSRNTSGNVSTRCGPDSFEAAFRAFLAMLDRERSLAPEVLGELAEALARDVAANPALRAQGFTRPQLLAFMSEQAGLRHDLKILIQPDLQAGVPDGAGKPSGFGVSFDIRTPEDIRPLALNAQLYRDPGRLHFLGGYIGPEVEGMLGPQAIGGCRAIARDMARAGYRGPANFDLLRDGDGRLRFVDDINPRLTGIFPTLAVHAALRGHPASRSVLSTGYRGEVMLEDIRAALLRLDDAGLLLTRSRSRGAVLLPNLSADFGYDLHLAGYPLEQAGSVLAPGGALETALGSPIQRPAA